MNALKSMTGIVVAVTVAAGSGCAGDPSGPSNQVRVVFTGTVLHVRDRHVLLDGRIRVGQTVVGSYMYGMEAVDNDGRATVGRYRHTTQPYGISFTVGGLTFETDPTNVDFDVIVSDNHGRILRDSYQLTSSSNRMPHNAAGDGRIYLGLHDTTGTALSSTALPGSAPDLADWQFSGLLAIAANYEVSVHVTKIGKGFTF